MTHPYVGILHIGISVEMASGAVLVGSCFVLGLLDANTQVRLDPILCASNHSRLRLSNICDYVLQQAGRQADRQADKTMVQVYGG